MAVKTLFSILVFFSLCTADASSSTQGDLSGYAVHLIAYDVRTAQSSGSVSSQLPGESTVTDRYSSEYSPSLSYYGISVGYENIKRSGLGWSAHLQIYPTSTGDDMHGSKLFAIDANGVYPISRNFNAYGGINLSVSSRPDNLAYAKYITRPEIGGQFGVGVDFKRWMFRIGYQFFRQKIESELRQASGYVKSTSSSAAQVNGYTAAIGYIF